MDDVKGALDNLRSALAEKRAAGQRLQTAREAVRAAQARALDADTALSEARDLVDARTKDLHAALLAATETPPAAYMESVAWDAEIPAAG